MATELGKAFVQIVPSAEGISGSITNLLGGEADSAGKAAGESFGGKLISTLKKVVVAAGIGKVIKDSLFVGGDLQQSIGGVETLFKDSANVVREYADNAYKTAGLSANAYMESVTGFSASLLQSLGGDTAKSAEVAHMAMVDMADNSNKMGTAMESIQNAYQGFAKQNYTMLDNLKLGYGGTKQEMERLLKDATKLTGVKYDINNLNDVYSAIHAVQEELGITGTTALEAEATFTGSLSALKGSWENLMGAMSTGEDWDSALQGMMQSLLTFLGNAVPMAIDVVRDLPLMIINLLRDAGPDLIAVGGEAISSLLTGWGTRMPDMLVGGSQAVLGLIQGMVTQLPMLIQGSATLLTGLAEGITQSLPILIPGVIEIINSIIATLLENLPMLVSAGLALFSALVLALPEIISAIVAVLPTIIIGIVSALSDMIPMLIEAGISLLTALVGDLPGIIQELVTALPVIIDAIVDAVMDNLPLIIQAGIDLLSALVEALPEIISVIIAVIPKIVDSILGATNKLVPLLIKAGIDLFTAIVNDLSTIIQLIVKVLPTIIDAIIKALLNNLPLLINAGIELLTAIVDNLPTIIRLIVAVLPTIIDAILKALFTALPLLIQAGVQLLTALIDNLPLIIMTIVNALPLIIDGICRALLDNLPLIVSAGVTLFVAILGDLPLIISRLVAMIPGIIRALIDALKKGLSQMKDVGKQLLQGLGDGIKGAIGGVVNKARDAASNVVNGVKNFFGIRSPSRVFMGIGEELDKGLAAGIADNVRPITKAMNDVAQLTTRSFESEFALNASTYGVTGKLAKSINSGAMDSLSERSLPLVLNLLIDGQAFASAVVDDITKIQDRKVELELAY